MRLESPLYLLLLLILPAAVFYLRRWKGSSFIRHSALTTMQSIAPTLKVRLKFIPSLFRIIALGLIIVAITRPQFGREKINDYSKGIAIEMVLDRSSSMSEAMEFDGKAMTRLDAVKLVFEEFVKGNDDELAGRENDLIGLIAFAGFADTICPLTLGHNGLLQLGRQVRLVNVREEDGTAIGNALALAAARLNKAEENLKKRGAELRDDYIIKSKAIILLTDGVNNRGDITPSQAAALAKKWGIKIYCIAIGDNRARQSGIFQMFNQRSLKSEMAYLDKIAKETGGIFQTAADSAALRKVYKEIDKLEKSEVESVKFLDYQERFLPSAIAAFILLLLEVILNNTFFRRVP
ncbi:MAG: VWA domain-containing protein [Planctomycetota bacterium]